MTRRAKTVSQSTTLRDPRNTRGFKPEHYPKADGVCAPPPNTSDTEEEIKLRFLAVYYELNQCYARLLQVRGKRPSSASANEPRERRELRRIEKALRRRDALEDQYASLGVIAEPVVSKGLTVDVKFGFGRIRSIANRDAIPRYSSAYLSIPVPDWVIGAAESKVNHKRTDRSET